MHGFASCNVRQRMLLIHQTTCNLCAGKGTSPNLARIVNTIRSTRLSGNHMSPSQHHKWEVRRVLCMTCAS